MSMGPIMCYLAFPTTTRTSLTDRLEGHTSTMDASYRKSHDGWLTALATLHHAVDAALAGDPDAAARHLLDGKRQLVACNDALSALGRALVALRSELFERDDVDPTEPLIAREPFFVTLDYDGIYRELAEQGAALPQRAFWEEVASRLRAGGARSGCRLLEKLLRALQTHLHGFMAEVEAATALPLDPMTHALHGASLPIARVTTGYTHLLTAFSYVSLLCERATQAYERAARQPAPMQVQAAS